MTSKRVSASFNSIFDDNLSEESDNLNTLRISEIEPNKSQPRKNFDREALEQLAASIKENGVLQPLIVRPLPAGNYQIIAGERRWRAAKIAGLSELPVIIRDDLTEDQVLQIALIENLQRENLNPIEEAQGYKELLDHYNMTQEELSKVIGKPRSSIANSLSLLNMPKGIKDMLSNNEISMGHCKALKAIKDQALMMELAHRAAKGELSVRGIETVAKREAGKDKKPEVKPRLSYYTEVELSLTELLGTKVRIMEGSKINTLQISFEDANQLEGIMDTLMAKPKDI